MFIRKRVDEILISIYEKEGEIEEIQDEINNLYKTVKKLQYIEDNYTDLNFDDFVHLFILVRDYCLRKNINWHDYNIPLGNFNVCDMYNNQAIFISFIKML